MSIKFKCHWLFLKKLLSTLSIQKENKQAVIFRNIKLNIFNFRSFSKAHSNKYNKPLQKDNEVSVLPNTDINPRSSCRKSENDLGLPKS